MWFKSSIFKGVFLWTPFSRTTGGAGLQRECRVGEGLHCSRSGIRRKPHSLKEKAAPSPAEATARTSGESLQSVSSSARREEAALPPSGRKAPRHPRGTSRPAAPRLGGHGGKAASGLSKAIRGLPASSPPGFPQRSCSHRPRPRVTKWRLLFVCRHRAPPLPSGPGGNRDHGCRLPPPDLRGEAPHRC